MIHPLIQQYFIIDLIGFFRPAVAERKRDAVLRRWTITTTSPTRDTHTGPPLFLVCPNTPSYPRYPSYPRLPAFNLLPYSLQDHWSLPIPLATLLRGNVVKVTFLHALPNIYCSSSPCYRYYLCVLKNCSYFYILYLQLFLSIMVTGYPPPQPLLRGSL